MAKYLCAVCGYEYDEDLGDEEFNIEPGTLWEDLEDDFVCPMCGAEKENFERE